MTDSTAPADVAATPSGLKKVAADIGLKAYMKAPPPVQNAMLTGFTKAQPVVAKVSPHAKKIVGGGLALVAVRKLRHRGK